MPRPRVRRITGLEWGDVTGYLKELRIAFLQAKQNHNTELLNALRPVIWRLRRRQKRFLKRPKQKRISERRLRMRRLA